MCQKPNSVRISPCKITPGFNSGYDSVVDECMAVFLQNLANEGFCTVFSCCGHGKYGPGLVMYLNDYSQVDDMILRLKGENWENIHWTRRPGLANKYEYAFYGRKDKLPSLLEIDCT